MKTILILGLNLLLTMTVFSQSIGKIGGVNAPARIGSVRIDSIKSIQSVNVVPPMPRIGDYRYGGVVFYIDDTGKHGLVCAVRDQDHTFWGCSEVITGADGKAIGTGAQNTIDIINADCSNEVHSAAEVCFGQTFNGYSDWFLPSQDELNEMYQNRTIINATAIANGGKAFYAGDVYYWSSTEEYYNDNDGFIVNAALGLHFIDGHLEVRDKRDFNWVRAVRAF